MSVVAAAEPLSIGIEFSIVSGVAAAFQATSQRTPQVDGEVAADPPGVPGPDRPGRPGDLERPVAVVVVALEALGDRVEPGEVPLRDVVGGAGRDAPADVGGHRGEGHDPLALQVPQRVHARGHELGAELDVVAAAVPGQVVAGLAVVLVEPLREVVGLADGQPREAVLEGVADLRQPLVGPLEVVVAELHFLDQVAADHPRPRAEHVGGLLGLDRGVRGMAGGGEDEGIRPVPVRAADAQSVVAWSAGSRRGPGSSTASS